MSARPLIGLIGENIALSLAPALHEDAFAAHGLEGRYHLIEFAKRDRRTLQQALDGARAVGMLGVNITHPFKEAVLALLDRVADTAREAGAVNTVVFEADGGSHGYNTDRGGFRAALPAELGEGAARGRTVLVLGAGGAGCA
ncbi:MAG: shikimate dehydrogenase, partial [Alphaproteobacteria bacterium]|nr:shikimate dehydrogenase [Alphaproteobacteria bacterium]